MNKFFTLLFVVFYASVMSAQVIVLNENFDALSIPDLPMGWTTTTNYDIGFRTESSNPSNNGGASGLNNVVIRNTDSTGVYTLTSPLISTVGLIEVGVLWSSRVSNNFPTPGSTTPLLEYSANGGLSWSALSYAENLNNSTWDVVNDSIPILLPQDAWSNPYVQLRWTVNITNDPSGTYRMDDIKVIGEINPTASLKMRVNMSSEIVSPEGVFIAGDFNGWDSGSNTMVNIGGGVYEYEVEVNTGTEVKFRFYNGSGGLSEVVPDLCGVDDGNGSGLGRSITVGLNDTIYGPVCFSSCDNCIIVEPIFVNLHVQVDASQQIVSPQGIFITGPFDQGNYGTFVMNDLGNGLYDYTATVLEGSIVQYRFQNGADASGLEVIPPPCGVLNATSEYVREVFIGNQDVELIPVCFSECAACIINNPDTVNFTVQVDLSQQTVSPQGVFIVGPFNAGMQATLPMDDLGNGIYEFGAAVIQGDVINYFFQNGLNSSGAEMVPSACGQQDAGGTYLRQVIVGDVDIQIPVVCFSACGPCEVIHVQESNESVFQLWPNPVQQILNVRINTSLMGAECVLTNATGQVLLRQTVSNDTLALDLADLPNGVYLFSVIHATKMESRTIILDQGLTNR